VIVRGAARAAQAHRKCRIESRAMHRHAAPDADKPEANKLKA